MGHIRRPTHGTPFVTVAGAGNPLASTTGFTMDDPVPPIVQNTYTGNEDQIRDIKLRRYLIHEAFFVLFEIPGWYRVELTRRSEEVEIKSFMLQMLFMATLHAAKLVRPAAQPFVKEITEEMLQTLYLGYRQSSTKSTLYYQWPMSEDIEEQQEDHLTLAVARLLHMTKSHANPVTNITEQLIQQEDLPRSESNETSEEEEIEIENQVTENNQNLNSVNPDA